MTSVIDNDILLKGACYGLLIQITRQISVEQSIGVLGAARFVVPKRITKNPPKKGAQAALDVFNAFLDTAVVLETTEDEQLMAADLELAAQRSGLTLDSGESQLCAIVFHRSVPLMSTGDKRAIYSIDCMLEHDTRLKALCGRVRCLEQIFLSALDEVDALPILRAAVCGEPQVDKALSICFTCHSPALDKEEATRGLQSYVSDLRNIAPHVLAA